MKQLVIHPFFMIGLAVRLALILAMAPLAVTDWYAPFLDVSIGALTFDPWFAWLASGGDIIAFPYGYAMWLAFLPLSLIAKMTGLPLLYAYDLTLLAADFCLLLVLHQFLPKRKLLLLLTYWLSPIIIFASYGLGLNDVIPVLLLMLSLLCVRRIKLRLAGIFLTAAISAKLSMVVAVPFFAIYLFNNRALRHISFDFILGFGASMLVFGGAFLFSGDGLRMLFGNPEMAVIYQLAIRLTDNVSIFVIPLSYLVMLYLTWRVRRLNFDLFQATIGIAFLLIVFMTPSSPGWFVWCIPFLILYQAVSGRIAILIVGVFSIIYVLSTLLLTQLHFITGNEFTLGTAINTLGQNSGRATSLLHTVMVAIGGILAIRVWRESIGRNDFFRLSRKPFAIGVAGDSGAGKDTFVDAISGLFGAHSVVKISGDDYHLWDRQKPMWKVMTHLNPMANDLEGFCNDLVLLTDGKSVRSKHYNHQTGQMSKLFKINSNDVVIASGLHALYHPLIREFYNLKIYLDIDEELRRHFKIKRDVNQRGHTLERVLSSFEKREPDAEQFIRPQAKHADLILSLQPIHPRMLEELDDKQAVRLKLVANARNGFNELSLHRALVGICGLHVDVEVSNDGSDVQLTIEGEASADDIAMAAQMLFPHVQEFLDISPNWQDGMLGMMQLITLTHINQALTKGLIK